MSEELVERVAKAIDPEAWDALVDGRDRPGTFWNTRRGIARDKASAAIAVMKETVNGE